MKNFSNLLKVTALAVFVVSTTGVAEAKMATNSYVGSTQNTGAQPSKPTAHVRIGKTNVSANVKAQNGVYAGGGTSSGGKARGAWTGAKSAPK